MNNTMKTLEEFLELFCDELDHTDASKITSSTDFKNIGEWDSLLALSIISMIDEEFEVLLTGNDMLNSTSLSDLYELIQTKSS
jgi:acyl carrier protein